MQVDPKGLEAARQAIRYLLHPETPWSDEQVGGVIAAYLSASEKEGAKPVGDDLPHGEWWMFYDHQIGQWCVYDDGPPRVVRTGAEVFHVREVKSTHPPASEAKPVGVDELAQAIRAVDGDNSLGAGALAEAIMSRLPLVVSHEMPVGDAQPGLAVADETQAKPVAWMTADGRVATDETKRTAMARPSREVFNIPLYAHPGADR